MLMGGKTPGRIGREPLLCRRVAKALEDAGFNARTEVSGRVDIAIVNTGDSRLECVIEAKFLFCHDCKQRDIGHQFFVNVWNDIEKRRHFGVPHYAVVLAADYQTMCPDGAALGLYHANAIRSHLAKHGPQNSAGGVDCCGFARFERDLFREFKPKCDILPQAGGYSRNHTWRAEHLGAVALIRAWLLGVRPDGRG